jgi:pimeloyl-ACP methyl ester carboxylesterase
LILDADILPDYRRLNASAIQTRTPCGPDHTMVWRRWGKGAPLVLLHGGSGGWSHWLKNIDALSRTRELWVADLPGCGESDLPPGTYDADSLFQHVADGMALIDGGRPVDLVGFSFGSLVSGLIAAHRPEVVRRMVLTAPPALGLKAQPLELLSLGREMSPDEAEQAVRHNLKRLMLHNDAAIDDMAVALHAANFSGDRLRMRRLPRSRIMLSLKTMWRCPVYAIWGREDSLARQELHRLREVLEPCDLRELAIIDDAGHWVQYEEPEVFNRVLASLIG